jgi:ADP-dependent NAD(P)H-hydrate dehydratase / NAD(P)H-hydrate epimerase
MIPVLTPEMAAAADRASTEPVDVLMERAGMAVAWVAAEMGAGYGARVVVLVGPGNNGGDGYVAARHLLRRGAAVELHVLDPPRTDAARRAANEAAKVGVPQKSLDVPRSADLVIDAIFGGGFRQGIPASIARWIGSEPRVLAVDVPTGLEPGTGKVEHSAFRAERTVTFQALKLGHLFGEGPERCGKVEIADIGLPAMEPELRLCEDGDAPRPVRSRTAHKWSAGSVLVVGGSPGIGGAPLLAARAALRFGAGSVALACPGRLAVNYAAADPELLLRPAGDGDRFSPADAGTIADAAPRFDVVALGPGLGPKQEEFVARLLHSVSRPVVLDADGINAASPDLISRRAGPTVLTPHAGEFRRFGGTAAGPSEAAGLAVRTAATIVLKGSPTVVAGRERWVVNSGGPELATIGTGDVLTGMIGALWARGLDGEVAARSAAYWHGRAAAVLAGRRTVTAGSLIDGISEFAGVTG